MIRVATLALAIAAVGASAGAQSIGGGAPPLSTETTVLSFKAGDAGQFICSSGRLLLSAQAIRKDGTVAKLTYLVMGGGSNMSLMGVGGGAHPVPVAEGAPAINVVGFRLDVPAAGPVSAAAICGH